MYIPDPPDRSTRRLGIAGIALSALPPAATMRTASRAGHLRPAGRAAHLVQDSHGEEHQRGADEAVRGQPPWRAPARIHPPSAATSDQQEREARADSAVAWLTCVALPILWLSLRCVSTRMCPQTKRCAPLVSRRCRRLPARPLRAHHCDVVHARQLRRHVLVGPTQTFSAIGVPCW